jgi:DNA-binding transcriptional LysR family regulator
VKITLAQLEALVWVTRLGTVQEAAQRLNLAQPTVSLRLRDLGEALGKSLFYRDGRRLIPTIDARGIFDSACLILDEANKIVRTSRGQDDFNGIVRFGLSEAIAFAGLPSLMTDLARRYPNLRLEVAIRSNSVDLQHDLYEKNLDLALGIDLYEDDRVCVMPLGIQKAAWVASSRHDLPSLVCPSDILHLPIITNPRPSPMYRQSINWFHSAEMRPREISVSNSISAIARLVKAGIGIAVLPPKLVEADVENGSLVVLRCSPEIDHSHMAIAYRVNDWRPAIEAVVEVVREMLERMEWLEQYRSS